MARLKANLVQILPPLLDRRIVKRPEFLGGSRSVTGQLEQAVFAVRAFECPPLKERGVLPQFLRRDFLAESRNWRSLEVISRF